MLFLRKYLFQTMKIAVRHGANVFSFFSIVPTAFFATCLIFACFSLSALWAKERSYLYLGGKYKIFENYLTDM